MSKVGILSMQRILNYGSFLQAYGLKKILEDLGCNVVFVDYRPGECLVPPNGGRGVFRKISKGLEVLKYKASLKDKIAFIKYKNNYAENNYHYLEIDQRMNYTPELDLLVIGSDEVFNCVQNNTNVGFSLELFGEGNRAKRLISYAASFGNTTLSKLERYKVKDKIAECLSGFDAISVRDANSGEIVTELTGIVPEYNFDPVLAYDFMERCKEIPPRITETKYMILYGYSGRFTKSECEKIKLYAAEKGLKIFCIGGLQSCCDKFIDCSPFQVLAYFRDAECVVTDTFHGTIMSVITHNNFVSIVRKSGYGNAEKLTDLLKRLHLESRMTDDVGKLSQMLSFPIDYDETDNIIQKERRHTYQYLENQIKS